jgi:glycosyltransferase involved in cell wall biosynthesis
MTTSHPGDVPASPPVAWVETSAPAAGDTEPLVSVLMIAYNQEAYLAEAIASIVMQRCDFPFELIIGDDGSTDGSLRVALEFQRRYPAIVRILHGGPNLGMNANSRRVRAAARGRFLAWCEGDDYWCDADKLASQAAILRERVDVGAVHTDWVRSRRRGAAWEVDWARTVHRRVPLSLLQGDLLENFHNPVILRTCTLMFRKSIAEQVDASTFGAKNYDFGDAVTSLFIASSWKVAYLPVVSAVYRLSPGSALRSGVAARIRFLKSSLQFDADARAYMRGDPRYPDGYRWEMLVGLALWSLRGFDRQSFVFALRELRANFSVTGFAKAAAHAVWMRRKLFPARRPVHAPHRSRP